VRVIEVRVRTNSRAESLQQQADGSFVARVNAPPVDGRANEALIDLVATHFGLRKAQVTIRSGAGARLKRLQLED
jgi:uncharacterized protein YggU (UPF0235/DUF167 family)